eukprot:1188025-Prorocentrum_minimum.AAC.2
MPAISVSRPFGRLHSTELPFQPANSPPVTGECCSYQNGGAIRVFDGAELYLEGCEFSHNVAEGRAGGGAVAVLEGGLARIVNTDFSSNTGWQRNRPPSCENSDLSERSVAIRGARSVVARTRGDTSNHGRVSVG